MGIAFLYDILIIVIAVIPVVLVTHVMKLPAIVGFLVAGAIIGPYGLGFVDSPDRIAVLAEIGVALLLFHIGLEFSFENIRGITVIAVLGGVIQVALTVTAGMGLGAVFGWPLGARLVLGMAIAMTSTAIMLAMLSSKRMLHSPGSRIATGISIVQDLSVVPLIIVMGFFAGAGTGSDVFQAIGYAVAKFFAIVAGLLLFYRYVLCPLLNAIARTASRELFIIVVVGLALGTSVITEALGLSFATGAFLAGIMVSATDYRFYALTEIGPFRHCFAGLFFVSLGMLVDFKTAFVHLPELVTIVLFVIVVKFFIAGVSVVAFGYPVVVAATVGLLIAPIGEFSFLITHIGFREGLIGDHRYQLVVSATLVSMIIAPLLLELALKITPLCARINWRMPFRRREIGNTPEAYVIPEGHVIICGFGPLGQAVGRMLDRRGVPFVVLELNPETARKLRIKGHPVFIGDGASAELLLHSGIEKARLLAIAVPDYFNGMAIIHQAKAINPDIAIIARARYRNQVSDFYAAGADIVICEELEGGIEMGRYVLLQLGVEEEEAERFVEEVREFGSADFF